MNLSRDPWAERFARFKADLAMRGIYLNPPPRPVYGPRCKACHQRVVAGSGALIFGCCAACAHTDEAA